MDRFVLYELPREESKAERRSVPIDRRVDVEGLQCGEQVSLLVVKCLEQRLASQRADIVLVLSRPIHSSDGSLWIGTFAGLSRWKDQKLTNYANSIDLVTSIQRTPLHLERNH